MGNTLAVLDVSPYVYTGSYAPGFRDTRKFSCPTSGMIYFLKHLCSILNDIDDVILCFDSRSHRKALDGMYKANRNPNPGVYAQLDFLYEFLTRYGFTCLKVDGYEADDLIYTVVEKYKKRYQRINIYTSDYDIAHNVSDNVSCLAVNSTTMDVTPYSFSYVLGGKNNTVVYNTISVFKLFMGDSSDNIKPFKCAKYKPKELYNLFLKVLEQIGNYDIDVIKSREFVRLFIDDVLRNDLTSDEYSDLLNRIELIYPCYVEYSYDDTPCSINTVNRYDFATMLNSVGASDLNAEYIGIFRNTVNPDVDAYLRDLGNNFKSGYYAIDNDVINVCEKMDVDSYTLKGF